MVKITASAAEKAAAERRLAEVFGEGMLKPEDEIPVREYMVKWLSAFAADMELFDAKAFCLPRRMYRNYLWYAFSFQKTDAYIDEEADECYGEGFPGKCYLLLNTPNLLFSIDDGKLLTQEKLRELDNVIVFTEDYTETYVYTGKADTGPYYKRASGEM